jgi:hypothetical protein
MGLIHKEHGKISIEERRESFIIHPQYGYTDDDRIDEASGEFGKSWREEPHPEFMLEDLDDLITALTEMRDKKR